MTPAATLLIISHDVIGAQMAGPGIRYARLAEVLAAHLPVILAIPQSDQAPPALAGVEVVAYTPHDWTTLAPLIARATVCLAPGDIVADFAADFTTLATAPDAPALVVDGYDPVLAEWLAVHADLPLDAQAGLWPPRLARQTAPIRLGDFFICAGERQRDWWLGLLEAHGRINPATYAADPTLRRLVDVVPYGLPGDPPRAARPIVKGIWPGIDPDDQLVLWGGGLWPWLDPLTAIRAVARLTPTHPRLKLIFPGTRHPNPAVAQMPNQVNAAKALAAELGVIDRSVFFGDWVAYADWPAVLLESDVALSLHHATVETRLAFRSRLLETIWAGLPCVVSAGDATAELIAAYDVGVVTPVQDDAAVAAAIAALLDAPPSAANFDRARSDLTWEQAAAPLLAFCRAPARAPDRDRRLPAQVDSAQADLDALAQAQTEVQYWRDLARRYANGRFMRTMRRLDQLKQQLMRAFRR